MQLSFLDKLAMWWATLTKGWFNWQTSEYDIHVIPMGDIMMHTIQDNISVPNEDCSCRPIVQPVKRDDGSFGWIYKHQAKDGRE